MAMAPGQIKTDIAFTHIEEFHETDEFSLRSKQQQQAAINAILATPLDKDKPVTIPHYASRHGSVVKRIAEGLLMDINEGAGLATSAGD